MQYMSLHMWTVWFSSVNKLQDLTSDLLSEFLTGFKHICSRKKNNYNLYQSWFRSFDKDDHFQCVGGKPYFVCVCFLFCCWNTKPGFEVQIQMLVLFNHFLLKFGALFFSAQSWASFVRKEICASYGGFYFELQLHYISVLSWFIKHRPNIKIYLFCEKGKTPYVMNLQVNC